MVALVQFNRRGLADHQTVAALQLTGGFSTSPKWSLISMGCDFASKLIHLPTVGVIRDFTFAGI
jgi:hypothetical protein